MNSDDKIYLGSSKQFYPKQSPIEKFIESFHWGLEKIQNEAKSLFTSASGKTTLISDNGGNKYQIELCSPVSILPPMLSFEEARLKCQTWYAEVRTSVRIRNLSSKYSHSKEDNNTLLEKDITLFKIPYMSEYGTFIQDGNEYVLATLETNGRFISPGEQLYNFYKDELKRIKDTTAKNFREKNFRASNAEDSKSYLNYLGISNPNEVMNQIFACNHFKYCQDFNELGRAKAVCQAVRTEVESIFNNLQDELELDDDEHEIPNLDIKNKMSTTDLLELNEGKKNQSFYVLSAATIFERDENGNYTGNLSAPYYNVKNGVIDKDEVVYLNEKAFSDRNIAAFDSKELKVEDQNKQASIFNLQSLASSLTPFSNHNQGLRILMSNIHANSAATIENPEVPLVQTGTEKIVASWIGRMVLSPVSGTVKEIVKNSIIIEKEDHTTVSVPFFTNEKRNGKFLCSQRPVVSVSDKVVEGQLLCDGPNTKNGYFALGLNAHVAHIEDGTFEDMIRVSESFASKMTTRLGLREVIDLEGNSEDQEKTDKNVKNNELLSESGIVAINSHITGGSTICGIKSSKGIDKSYAVSEKEQSDYIVDSIQELSSKEIGSHKSSNIKRIIVNASCTHRAENQDKIANRHGNKGTIKIIPDNQMPLDPDGKPLDAIISGISMNKRLNYGQLLECIAGAIAHKLNKPIVVPTFDNNGLSALRQLCFENDIPDPENVYLTDPNTGKKYDRPSLVGYEYIYVLPHLASEKFMQRGLGNRIDYSLISGQGIGSKNKGKGRLASKMLNDALYATGEFGKEFRLHNEKQSNYYDSNKLYLDIVDKNAHQSTARGTKDIINTYVRAAMEGSGLKFDLIEKEARVR